MGDEQRFLDLVLADPTVSAVLDRAPALGLPDCWLTAGVLFQAVWNGLTGRPPGHGVRDADLFYFSSDTSWDAEDAVIRRAAEVFVDPPVPVEVRNEARVHLWYAEHFGSAAPRAFTDCRDAIDHFAAVCCCVGLSVGAGPPEVPEVYAPHGFGDLLDLVVRPNPGPAPRHVYEAKAARWQATWPELTVLPFG